MKKFSLIISALALVMGLSQCQKRPNMPMYGYHTKSIQFAVSNEENSKGSLEQNPYKDLNYRWSQEDKIYVYESQTSDFTNGRLVGIMDLKSSDGYNAIFEKTFEKFPDKGYIRFIHFGSGIEVPVEGENAGASPDVIFGNQDGLLSTISSKVIAIRDFKVEAETDNYSGTLEVQYAVVKMKFKGFT